MLFYVNACKNVFTFSAQKSLYVPHLSALKITQIEGKYIAFSAQGINLSCKVPVVRFLWLALELQGAYQRVSNFC